MTGPNYISHTRKITRYLGTVISFRHEWSRSKKKVETLKDSHREEVLKCT